MSTLEKFRKSKEAADKVKDSVIKGIEEGGNVEELLQELLDQQPKACVPICGGICTVTCVADGPLPVTDAVAGFGALGGAGLATKEFG
jgi:hypothetical protein